MPYNPAPTARGFLEQADQQERENLVVRVAVLDDESSRRFFGTRLARRGVQPVWVEVTNRSERPCRLQFVAMDPNYFSPLEAAARCHYSGGRRLLEFGFLAWLFLPLLLLLPFRLRTIYRANRQMDDYFHEHAFRMRPIESGATQSGFVFTNVSEGTKVVPVRLLTTQGTHDFEFSVPVRGLQVDHHHRAFESLHPDESLREVDQDELRRYLVSAPAATTNVHGQRAGDPVNLVVIGDFSRIIGAFGACWDETEVISLSTCWKTARAFIMGTEYRYSPVSALYLMTRCQDFALQRIRDSINQRLHLRLWSTELKFKGQRVWVGQVSRDIGVRFTWKTWNLTTHRIDADVDEARDYVVEDLLQLGRLELAAYVPGVGECSRQAPRHNLTGDPYYTDGKRAVIFLSSERTEPKFVALD